MGPLKNRYFGIRHGESEANVEGIVISDPQVGTCRYGLSVEGCRQVRESLEQVVGLDASCLIIASDFLRTAETANLVRDVLGTEAVRFDVRLRERFFGEWEGMSYTNYSVAWEHDTQDPDHTRAGVESARAVRRRMVDAVMSLEDEFSAKNIALVSHGDPLLLLQTAFVDWPVSRHRSLTGFRTAEIRALN